MTPLLTTIVLTALAAVVVVLTRVRMTRNDGAAAGRLSIPQIVPNTHTVGGVLALATWIPFLVVDNRMLGLAGLVAWWVTAVAGLLVLARWLPARGRHSSAPKADTWGEGPGLSVLAHVGLLVGAVTFTVLFVLESIP